jgi:hypothetical protein
MFYARVLMIVILIHVLFLSCNQKPPNVSIQLKSNFLSHLKKMDSTVVLDSFKLIGIDSIDQKLERTIDDTIYTREFSRVQAQFANAIKEKKEDSIEFYQGEIDYMTPQVDSLTKVISKADTSKKLGMVVTCRIQLSKHNRSVDWIIYYFLDKNMKIWNSEMIDSSIVTISRNLN